MIFALETWGDGTTRLTHWDSVHGDDVVFVRRDDGAFRSIYAGEGKEQLLEQVDLLAELRRLAKQ